MSRILPENIEVLITSFGGVGTTFINRFVAQFKSTNHYGDADLLKHLSIPPCSFNPRVRFVYVTGDPILAVISLFRRNYQYVHSEKLQSQQRLVISPIPREMTLDEYARIGRDRFMFESHFENWYRRYSLHPTAFVRYERLWDNLEPLFDFLGLSTSALNDFPIKKERESSLAGISVETLQGLDQMYGGFQKKLDALSDYEVRPDRRNPGRAGIIFSGNMRAVISGRVKRGLANYLYDHHPVRHKRLKGAVQSRRNQ